ncbi:GNAT family N-acetyltransferase [Maritimibacter sp. HL-12]|jgi:RimJ/RimL family protein N-acetyltransferase|uniref:GNAT family N-acetyltransferase n=1 Tax=Maritimibacter sp. HL-12 TaxID=1162418 RepID=UPI000A0F2AAD|nr:GNAT family N-acetyltransferase [Maritimibacter sp. HL-12]SMH50799.1 Protein N-acetyltransferase, RimJ/RimL family [Maritimibacter sp. HL-12]
MTAHILAPTSFHIPTLETERLFLRALREDDVAEETAFFASERSALVGGPLTRDQVWRVVAAMIGHWALRGFGFWALEEKASGRYLGRVGLWAPDGWPEPELGWTLMAHAEGRGFAREAALTARAFAYDHLGWTTAISLIAAGNTRSETLASRLDATLERAWLHPVHGAMNIWRHPGAGGVL